VNKPKKILTDLILKEMVIPTNHQYDWPEPRTKREGSRFEDPERSEKI